MPPKNMNDWSSFEGLIKLILSQQQHVRKITRDANLAGHQVDFYVEAESYRGKIIRTAVEVKYSQLPITTKVVAEFSHIIAFLRKKKIIDRGILIAYKGFSPSVMKQARDKGVDLVSLDLLEKYKTELRLIKQPSILARKEPQPEPTKKLIFVLMPFSENLKDLYLYGIRGAAEKNGYVCRRADEIQHNSDVLKEILFYIEKADFLIAEVTEDNPNVYYELGIAHGKNKDVILLTKEGSEIPFDLKGKNHIIYSSINNLEEKLDKRLKGTTIA